MIINTNELDKNIRPIKYGGTGANTAEQALANLGGVSIVKLWENASPSSDFEAQIISLDLSEYDACRVFYSGINTEGAYLKSVDVPVGKNGRMDLIMGNGGYQGTSGTTFFAGGRNLVVGTSGIEFKAGYRYANTVADNRVCIPVIIFGIKGVQ